MQNDHTNDAPVLSAYRVSEASMIPTGLFAPEQAVKYKAYGDSISAEGAQSPGVVAPALAKGGQVPMKLKGKVESVCQKKGCWMKMPLPNGKLMHVTFADYAFFMPKDLAGQEVVMEGTASLDTLSVEWLRHYAEDAKKSKEEIAKITKPEITYQFEAKGVLVPVK